MDGLQFSGVLQAAANIPTAGDVGVYAVEMFLSDFPQFIKAEITPEPEPEQEQEICGSKEPIIPQPMLDLFVCNVNQTILPNRYFDMWRYAAGLYVAHYSTLYLKTYSPGSPSTEAAAVKGQPVGLIREAAMGDTSIKYDNEAITDAMSKWGTWNATQYGQQLVTMARMIGMGGMYVI